MLEGDGTLVDEKAQAVVSAAPGVSGRCQEGCFHWFVDCVVGTVPCEHAVVGDDLRVGRFKTEGCCLHEEVCGVAHVRKSGIGKRKCADFGLR